MSTEYSDYYQIAPELEESVEEHHNQLCDHLQTMWNSMGSTKPDLKPAYALDHLLKSLPELPAEFKENPKKYAEENVGLQLPEGVQLHFIDSQGNYWPQTDPSAFEAATEEDGLQPWARAEIRIAIRDEMGVGTIVIGMGDTPKEAIPHVPGTS